MGNPRFKAAAEAVRPTEELVRDFCIWLGYDAELNNDYRYDVILRKNGKVYTTIEIKEYPSITKYDHPAIMIEFENRNKPSGIVTTEAEWWMSVIHFKDHIGYYKIKTEDLRRMIRKIPFDIKEGGDDKASKMYRISLNYFIKQCTEVTKLYEYKKIRGI